MNKLIRVGESDNIQVDEWWCETEEEVLAIKNVPLFSKAILVTEKGEMIVYIMRSNGWTKIQ